MPITVASHTISPDERLRIEMPASRLPTGTWLSVPVEVINGKHKGPRLWLSGAVHGDELNGVEIIRRVLRDVSPADLSGTVIAVPIVNVYGFIEQSRYLPDRRDLNRSFPGSPRGSLASRLAHLFMQEVVSQCTHGIDLHTGSNHRTNVPQIRANLEDPETRRCADAFAAPVQMHSSTRDGSLREAATERGIHVLLYEAGEPLRFDEAAIRTGHNGVLRVMKRLGMIQKAPPRPRQKPLNVVSSSWLRARRSGVLHLTVAPGDMVHPRQIIGWVMDAFGDESRAIRTPNAGVVLGLTNNPLVNQGDGVVHIGRLSEESTDSPPADEPAQAPAAASEIGEAPPRLEQAADQSVDVPPDAL
ncbi:MAG: succinylglutamate desuccinylase/aspartoacylase family protein [Planctomycetaceae bacterium]|nr:succinylglutamate desuccinylase/aspartoacylase family protein [Planctomycetaceae bacterium]